MSIIERTAKELGIMEVEIFRKAAIANGYIDYDRQAAIWLSQYVQCRTLVTELLKWCEQELARTAKV